MILLLETIPIHLGIAVDFHNNEKYVNHEVAVGFSSFKCTHILYYSSLIRYSTAVKVNRTSHFSI